MAVSVFGAIREFGPSIDDWNSYTERLIANDAVSMKKKHAILLNSVGASTYKLIWNLTSPHSPASKTLKKNFRFS